MEYMLTTVDNPWNPFTDFWQWDLWDRQHGYNTTSFLSRVVASSLELAQADQESAIDAAIDEIARENVSGMHVKVTRDQAPIGS